MNNKRGFQETLRILTRLYMEDEEVRRVLNDFSVIMLHSLPDSVKQKMEDALNKPQPIRRDVYLDGGTVFIEFEDGTGWYLDRRLSTKGTDKRNLVYDRYPSDPDAQLLDVDQTEFMLMHGRVGK